MRTPDYRLADDAEVPILAINPDQASRSLSISPRSLWTLTKAGKIPSIRLGRSVRYSVDQLREWLREQSNENSSEESDAESNEPRENENGQPAANGVAKCKTQVRSREQAAQGVST